VRRPAPLKAAIEGPGNRIEQDLVRKRELPLRIPATGMLPVIASRLSESIVEEASTRGANPVEHSVEDWLPVLVLVETQVKEVVHESTGLRVAERVDELRFGDRVGMPFT